MDVVFDGDPAWRVTRELPDGTPYVIRPITPDDREGLQRGFAETSALTRYLRFGHATGALSDEELTYLTCVDQKDHVALVATITTPDLKTERGIGVARFIRSKDEHDVAEAAVVIVDDMQHEGVGHALTIELGKAALARGVTRLRADVLYGNTTMRAILERFGARPLASGPFDGTITYELDLRSAAAATERGEA